MITKIFVFCAFFNFDFVLVTDCRAECAMSGSWQQCVDQASGQPYYWHTGTDLVSWDCPPELSLPPPQLVTNISLATPATRENSPALPPSSLVSGYDSEDSDRDESCDKQPQATEIENIENCIGHVLPKPPDKGKEFSGKKSDEEADDILSLIEAEKPPDYSEPKPRLPSCKSNFRESSETHQPRSIVALANYEDSDEEEEEEEEKEDKSVTRLDRFGRMVFSKADSGQQDWQTEEQREALLSYRREELKNESSKKTERPDAVENLRKFDNSIPGHRKRRLDLPGGKFNKTENLRSGEEDTEESQKPELKYVPFVKSSSILEGAIEGNESNNEIQKVDKTAPEIEEIAGNNTVC